MSNTPEYPLYSQPYPMQPPPMPQPQKKNRKPFFIIGGIALGIVLCCGIPIALLSNNTSSSNTGTKINNSNQSSSQQTNNDTKKQEHFKVGEQIKIGDRFVVTVNSFKIGKSDNIYIKPKDGDKYVIVDVTIKNTLNDEQAVSSLMMFDLKDDEGQKYTETFLTGATPPDGKIAANDMLKGQLVYEVPTDKNRFTFSFIADWLSSGQTIWDLTLS
jgi:hypothetical protein